MGHTRHFIVGTVISYSKERKVGIALNAGKRIPFTLTDDFISEYNLDEVEGLSIAIFIHGKEVIPLFILEGLTTDEIVKRISEINIVHNTNKYHKHGVIKSASDEKIEVIQKDPLIFDRKIKTIKPGQVDNYDVLKKLKPNTQVIYKLSPWLYGSISEAEKFI